MFDSLAMAAYSGIGRAGSRSVGKVMSSIRGGMPMLAVNAKHKFWCHVMV
jgi:hypothetical protein